MSESGPAAKFNRFIRQSVQSEDDIRELLESIPADQWSPALRQEFMGWLKAEEQSGRADEVFTRKKRLFWEEAGRRTGFS